MDIRNGRHCSHKIDNKQQINDGCRKRTSPYFFTPDFDFLCIKNIYIFKTLLFFSSSLSHSIVARIHHRREFNASHVMMVCNSLFSCFPMHFCWDMYACVFVGSILTCDWMATTIPWNFSCFYCIRHISNANVHMHIHSKHLTTKCLKKTKKYAGGTTPFLSLFAKFAGRFSDF